MSEVRALIKEGEDSDGIVLRRGPSRQAQGAGVLVVGLTLAALALATFVRQEAGLVARGPMGEVVELEENACDKYPYLKYAVPNAVEYNNLANKGPDHGRGEGILFKTIDLGKAAGNELDKEVYLTVNATSKNYKPFSPRLNGMQGKYGSINLNSGSSVDLEFHFFDRNTMEPLKLPEFAMTWFDLDTGSNGKSVEFVEIGGFKSYHLTKNSEVVVEKQPDGRTKFSASTVGTGEDNPKDPMFLTQQQKNRAVTLLYGETHSLKVTIGASPGTGPRFFTFVGRPSLLCAVTVQQNFKPPLPDLTFTPPMEGAIITGEGETFVSFAVKKGDHVLKDTLIATTQREGQPPHKYLAPFEGTVTQIQDKLQPQEKLDMRLSEKILAVIQRPSFKPLPQTAGGPLGIVGGGPGADAESGLSLDALFVKYLVQVGDAVSKDDPIALVKTEEREVAVKATDFGEVKQRQEGLKRGMLIRAVEDGNIITLAPFTPLGPLSKHNVAAGKVDGAGYIFGKYHVKKGDIIKEGDPVATVMDKHGKEHIITAFRGGVVSDLQPVSSGAPIDRIVDRNLCTTGKFAPLPLGSGMAPVTMAGAFDNPESLKVSGPDPLAVPEGIEKSGLKFVKYYVKKGDVVETGDSVVMVETEQGELRDIRAPRPGVVKHVQDGLKQGMLLGHVMQNTNLASVGQLPSLEVTEEEEGSFAPRRGDWKFKEFKVQVGDDVATGDPIAELEGPGGEIKVVRASKSGTVSEILAHLQPGDDVEEVTTDEDLATIGLLKAPQMSFQEMGVEVENPDSVFEEWRVKQGQSVNVGDPIAVVQLPIRLLREADGSVRRLGGREQTIPSPGTGYVSYMADLKPGKRISDQTLSPTIAKVQLGWPWWLWLLGALCLLLCLALLLLLALRKKEEYKPMPAPPPAPVPKAEPKPEPQPEPTPEPPVVVPPPQPPPEPEGLRLDFNDNGSVRTVYARYKPLGIKHHHVAPIVAHDFTCNSYAKQELGVQAGWKLTRIGSEELNDTQDFDRVNHMLSTYTQDFPVWPLSLEFRKDPNDAETHTFRFTDRPLGMEFTNVAPIKVDKVYAGSPAASQRVDVGWYLTRIGDFDVHESHNFREVLHIFKEGVQGLHDDGKKYQEAQ